MLSFKEQVGLVYSPSRFAILGGQSVIFERRHVGCAAVSCVRVLAGGLREQFVPYMKSCVSSILILLKDKDKRMLEEVHKALRAIVGVSMTLQELCMQ